MKNECGCRVCSVGLWQWPTSAVVAAIVGMVVVGGGRYPLWIDVVVYANVGMMAYAVIRNLVLKVRWKHEDAE